MLTSLSRTTEWTSRDVALPANQGQQGHERLPALDGLRGIAILLVMLLHFGGSEKLPGLKKLDLSWVEQAYLKVVDAGACGVDLFFVLSGFLITGILFSTKDSSRYFRNFYLRRTLRIFPLYYGILITLFFLLPRLPLGNLSAVHQMADRQAGLWFYCANVMIAWEETTVYNIDWLQFSHFWSLAVEEHFYLIWPAIVFALNRKTLMKVCGGCILFALVLRLILSGSGHGWSAYVLTPCRIDGLALGSWLALAARGPHGMSRLRPWAWIVTPLAFILVLALSFAKAKAPAASWAIGSLSSTLYAFFFGGFIVFAVTSSTSSLIYGLFSMRSLTFLGQYSYGLYVFHYLLRPVFKEIIPIDALITWSGSSFLGLLLFAALAILLSIIPAWLSWHLFEKHFLKLKRYFSYETRNGARATPQRPSIPLGLAKSA
jgi:peptidoglycan/LPS O-acetylase OafA/YrhL